jgi:predicted GIY-YIG superfamily endonuclease
MSYRLPAEHREWKIQLIEKQNPSWVDLSDTLI